MATYESGSWKNLPTDPDAPDWRGKAGELLPELRNSLLGDEIEKAFSPMSLWGEIEILFDRAYEEPRNDDLIRRVYAFAEWSVTQTWRREFGVDDLPTAATVSFYEHLPVKPAIRADMPRWLTRQRIMQNEAVFRYFLNSEQEWHDLLALWDARPRHPAKKKKRS